MKRFLLLLIPLFLGVFNLWGTTVTIGTGTTTTRYPLNDYYKYSRSQALYLSTEIGIPSGSITNIRWYRNDLGADPNAIGTTEIWLMETTNSVLTGTSWEGPGTLVATISNIDLGAGGAWFDIAITAYAYSGGNLLVSVRTQDAPYTIPHAYWRYTSTSANYRMRQGNNDLTNPPTMALSYNRPNIQFEILTSSPNLVAVPSTLTFGYTPSGGTSAPKTYVLSGTYLDGSPILVSAPPGFEVSTDGIGYGPVVNIVYLPPTLPDTTVYVRFVPVTPDTDYSGNIINNGGGASKTVSVSGTSWEYKKWCTSTATSVLDEDIFNVTIGTINNTSNCITPAPGDGSVLKLYGNYYYHVAPATLQRLTNVTFSVQVGTCGTSSYNNAMKIFIDYNQDGDFTDAGEEAYVSPALTLGPHTETGNFAIPVSAVLGATMMRIVVVETPTGGPGGISSCGTYTYGETEDYKVIISEVPSCPPPTALIAGSITAHSANLSWTPIGTESIWEYVYGLSPLPVPVGSGTTTFSSSFNPISPLLQNTNYDFYVRAMCISEQSTWSGPKTFTTLCDFSTVPYFEDFDAVTAPAIPACITVTDDNGDAKKWVTYATNPLSAPNAMAISFSSTLAMDDWFFSPALNLTAGVPYEVKFHYRAESASYPEKLLVSWGSAPGAAGMTGGIIWDNSSIINTTYAEGTGIFTPAADGLFYIGWHGYSDVDMWRLYVDDISVAPLTVHSVHELYTDLSVQEGDTVNVVGYYTNPDYYFLLDFYGDWDKDTPLPAQSYLVLENVLPPDSAQNGGYVLVKGIVHYVSNPGSYHSEDSLIIHVNSLSTEVFYRGMGSAAKSGFREEGKIIEYEIKGPTECDPCKFAVLISGGVDAANNHSKYWENLVALYKFKVDNQGYCPENVHVHYYDGVARDARIPQSSVSSADSISIHNSFKSVSQSVANCTKSGKPATFQKMITNHGEADGDICLLNKNVLKPDEVKNMEQAIIDSCCSNMYDELLECYAGTTVDVLSTLNILNKATIYVNSNSDKNCGYSPHDSVHPYLQAKINMLKAGFPYPKAVDSARKAYKKYLQYLIDYAHWAANWYRNHPTYPNADSLRDKWVKDSTDLANALNSTRNVILTPMKKFCEWKEFVIPPGGQLVLEFEGDDENCGNVTVNVVDPVTGVVKTIVFNWNIPGSAGYSPGNNKRVINGDPNKSTTVRVHDDNNGAGYTLKVSSDATQSLPQSVSNEHSFAGFSFGGTDSSSAEFGNITEPEMMIPNIDQLPLMLNTLPARMGSGFVQTFGFTFTIDTSDVYWKNMQLYLNIIEVSVPTVLMIHSPNCDCGMLMQTITEPGVYNVSLGDMTIAGPMGFMQLMVYGSGKAPSADGFSFDAWALRTGEGQGGPGSSLDYGDAPDGPYQTLKGHNGASHAPVPGMPVWLGTTVDTESDGHPNSNATGDDLNMADDEDGVTFNPPLYPGQPATINIVVSVGFAFLQGWIDFNADGDWADPGEQIITDLNLPAGANQFNFIVPANAVIGNTFARFRLSSMPGIPYYGAASNGEVEDYQVLIDQPPMDYGDAPDPAYPTLLANDGARHTLSPGIYMGNLIDIEPDGQPNITATGDNINNLNDEDGVIFNSALYPGQPATLTVISSIANAVVQGWIDFNADGDWADPGEQIISNLLTVPGNNVVSYNVPPGATIGQTFSRFRLSTLPGLTFTGAALDGEVEDHSVTIVQEQQELDYGDAPDPTYPTKLANDGARHTLIPVIYMGSLIDAEPDGQPNATATGDDINNLNDEDGVIIGSPLNPGQPVAISVTASVSGYLNAWIDFDRNGSWAEANNQIITDFSLSPGINNFVIIVPGGASIGITYARFRFASYPGLTYYGQATDGEVEDYSVTIVQEQQELDYGDAPDPAYPTLLPNDGARHTLSPGIYMGNLIDIEPDGQPNATATGDNINNSNDEDGVIFNTALYPGQPATLTVISSIANAVVQGWIDFNADGDWADPGEQIITNLLTVPGNNVVSYNVPPGATIGITFSRFRLSTLPGLTFTGAALDGEVEDYSVTIVQEQQELDYGDAPDLPYPTMLANNGARHILTTGIYLGNLIDSEPDGQVDDNSNNLQDEDGVVFNTPMYPGKPATLTVVVASIGPAFLQGWLDFNADGDWADPGEQIFTDVLVLPGANALNFPVPISAQVGPTFVRFRLSTSTGLSYTGLAQDGEVEDYPVIIEEAPIELDYGDAPDSYTTLLASNGARHYRNGTTYLGTLVDTENDGQPSVNADGDDLLSSDDEDGVTFMWPVSAGNPCKLNVNASVGDAFLNGWVDFNGNGSFADAGEQIFTDLNISAGNNYLTFVTPTTAITGQTYARFRFSHQLSLSYTGLASDGEVEDYLVSITTLGQLKWQQSPDVTLPGTHAHSGIQVADDWQCNGGLVTSVNWWGNYELDAVGQEKRGIGINHFLVSIHSNNGCLPLDPPLASFIVPFNQITETYIGLINNEGCPVYYYSYTLPQPFAQVQGTFYWLSIIANPNDINNPAVWRWQEANRWYFPILCGAANQTNLIPWQTIVTGSPSKYLDMAFEITSQASGTCVDPDPSDSFVQNEISMALVPGNTPGVPTALIAAYNDQPYGGGPGLGVSYSNDGGTTWNPQQLPYPSNPLGIPFIDAFDPAATADGSGNVYVAHISTDYDWVNGPESGFYIHKSTDGGVTWASPVQISYDPKPISSPDPNYRFNDRCQIIADVNPASPCFNNIYAVWIKDRGWNMSTPMGDIYFSASTNGGATWSSAVILNENQHNMANMPNPAVAHDGTIYICWIDYDCVTGGIGKIYLNSSADGGITWSAADTLVAIVTLPPIRLNSGSDVLAKGAAVLGVSPSNSQKLYLTFSQRSLLTIDEGTILFMSSADGGATWTTPVQVNDDATTNDQVLPWMKVKPNGTIDIAWYDRRNDPSDLNWDVYMATSTDEGNTFATNVQVNLTPAAASPSTPSGLWMGEYLGLETDSSYAYICYTSSCSDTKGDIYFNKFLNPTVYIDFGDAPDPSYPSLLASDGARHNINPGVYMGAIIDSEANGQPNASSTGDDINGSDDEDGVVFTTPLNPGMSASVTITVSSVLWPVFLQGWIDFNIDGDWADAGEQIIVDFPATAGGNIINFTVPAGASIGSTYARFRLSSQPGLQYYGLAPDGEVEDYRVLSTMADLDYGDAPDPNYPTYLASNGARHANDGITYLGLLIDTESNGVPSANADGDDLNGSDDEDGVVIGSPINPGQSFTITVTASVSGYLNAWIDFDGNGSWAETDNHVFTDLWLTAGVNNLAVLAPSSASIGTTYARFRFASYPGLTYTGQATDGEVEDYRIEIEQEQQQLDFGDAPNLYPTLLAIDGARHVLDGITYLGTLEDAEADGVPSVNCLGDDLAGSDDEDGVVFLWPLSAGNPCKIKVTASVANAFFNGWFDFNGNGSWADTGEQVFTDLSLLAGDNYLTFVAPASIAASQVYTRFRFSHQPSLSYTGLASDGEVEDYLVEITEYGEIKWQQLPDTTLPGSHAHDLFVADDFICNGGQITQIEWWGNYELDPYGNEKRGSGINSWTLQIHANANCLPVEPALQSYTINPSALVEVNTGLANDEDSPIYYYSYTLPQPYNQIPGTHYWISIMLVSGDPSDPPVWRWQEAYRGYYPVLCGAATSSYVTPWQTIQIGSPSQFMDMAFVIKSSVAQDIDYGDAPDSYQTLLLNDGGRHILDGSTQLGSLIDAESDGLPSALADGDDLNGVDDEDGVTFLTPVAAGQTCRIKVLASANNAFLNAWFDFNDNGTWSDAGEQIFTNQSLSVGDNYLTFQVPLGTAGSTTYARFRYSTQLSVPYYGLASDGELEDYMENVSMCDAGTVHDLYGDLTIQEGDTTFVVGFYSDTTQKFLLDFYGDWDKNTHLPAQSYLVLDDIQPPDSAMNGGYVVVKGIVDYVANPNSYHPEDSVIIHLSVLETAVYYRGEDTSSRSGWLENIRIRDNGFKAPTACDSCKFAVLISGGVDDANNHSKYWESLVALYKFKTEKQNYCPSNVKVHYYDGTGRDNRIPAGSVFPADSTSIAGSFQTISNGVAACSDKGTPATFQKFISNHGEEDGDICLTGDEVLTPEELKALEQMIIDSCCSTMYDEFTECYAKKAVDSLSTLDPLNKATININSNSDDNPSYSPHGVCDPYLQGKINALTAGCSYPQAVDSARKAYQRYLQGKIDYAHWAAQWYRTHPTVPNADSLRDKWVKDSTDRANAARATRCVTITPMKKFCDWKEFVIPPGGQLVLDFEGDDENCGNVTVTVIDPVTGATKTMVFNWNIPGSAGYQPGNNQRVINGDPTRSTTVKIHDDNNGPGYKLTTSSNTTQALVQSESNVHSFAGFSFGGTDGLSAEFGNITTPDLLIDGIDQLPLPLNTLPASMGTGYVENLTFTFTIDPLSIYWQNMQLYLNILSVTEPAALLVHSPNCGDMCMQEIAITEPGVYTVTLGDMTQSGVEGIIQMMLIGTGKAPLSSVVTFDCWALRTLGPPVQYFDFGDLPAPYPVLLADDGPRHLSDGSTFLGALIDSEPDGLPSPLADGDDLSGLDDEDGVQFLWPLSAGNPCKIKVTASVGDALLNTWIDFNSNGSWADAGEQIFSDLNLKAGDNYLTFIAPANVTAGQTYARFRFSHQPALSFTGLASDGEVEDYRINVSAYGEKWLQMPDINYPGLHTDNVIIVADDWVCNGGLVTGIHWWGNYEMDEITHLEKRGLGINNFLIKIYSNANCLPGIPLSTYIVPFSTIQETYTGSINIELSKIYYYKFILPQPFAQVPGTTYWVSIQAIPVSVQNPPVWRWQEANRWYYPIHCGAASMNQVSIWQTIFWPTPPPGKYSDMAFEITNSRLLTVNTYLEGLYNTAAGLMNEAQDVGVPMWGTGVADKITVELHDAINYNTIVYADEDVSLSTTGIATVTIPVVFNGSYFVTIKHRNSIETTTASPVSFAGSSITVSFDAPEKAYGNNLKLLLPGIYGIYAGDVSRDGVVDANDMIQVDNAAKEFWIGYIVTDVNGDGKVDNEDQLFIFNNSALFVIKLTP